ncbi:MAG: hypothetical protein QM778_17245 [Myxococcales bacterium]
MAWLAGLLVADWLGAAAGAFFASSLIGVAWSDRFERGKRAREARSSAP